MRIIAGRHRSRTILGPEDAQTTRPITDRVKESLFNRLRSLGALGYGHAADVFCGTGSLGLEALSRGAEHCTFVDQDRVAIKRLRQNLDTLGETEHASVIHSSALLPMWSAAIPDGQLAVAFLDPPYAMAADDKTRPVLTALMNALLPKLEDGGVLVFRTEAPTPADQAEGYDGPTSFTYGNMTLHFYQRPMDDEE